MIHALFLTSYLLLFLVAFFSMRASGYDFPRPISGFDFLVLCLASYRLTLLITEDRVFRFARAPFVREKRVKGPDGEETVEEEPCGRGVKRVIGELLLCGWCSGIWISTALVFAYVLFPDVVYLLLLTLATAAGAITVQIVNKCIDRANRNSSP